MSTRCYLVTQLALALVAFSACASRVAVPSKSAANLAGQQVTLTYLDTAGWRVDDGGHVLLIDPYVSRLNVEATTLPLAPNNTVIEQG